MTLSKQLRYLAAASGLLGSQAFAQTNPAATFNRYCVTCHSEKLKTGGFVLDPAKLSQVGANAEMWEKVDRNMRSFAMPPAGAPRPPGQALLPIQQAAIGRPPASLCGRPGR